MDDGLTTQGLDLAPRERMSDPSVRASVLAAAAVILTMVAIVSLVSLHVLPGTAGEISITVLAAGACVIAILAAFVGMRLGSTVRSDRLAAEALDCLPASHIVTTRAGRIIYANPAAAYLDASPDGPIAGLRRRLRGDQQRDSFQRLEAAALSGRAASGLITVSRADDQRMALDIDVRPLGGRSGRVLWRIEDVSERERQRELLQSERMRLVDVFDDAPVGLFSIDGGGRFLMVNRTLAEWLGLSTEALLSEGMQIQQFLLPSQPTPSRRPYDPFAPAEALEVILQGRQGRLTKASISQVVVRDAGGFRTRSVVRDLASEQTWEDALRMVRQRFQRFFEIAPVGIALVEPKGRFTETNRALEELLTDGMAKLAGRDLFEFVVDEASAGVRSRLAAVMLGEQQSRPLEIRLKGIREKTAALFVSRLEAEDGGLTGLILHFIDLTEQKNLELQFAQSQKMQAVGQLAGGVAHDFNNLLTAMIGFCDLLLLRFRPGDQSFADIMQIKQNGNRAANLVRQLLAFSRQQTLQPRMIDIADVLSELSHLLNRLLGDNVELKMLHGRNLGLVKVDQGQLEQVIINLAVNARDAMPGGGTLTIRTSRIESGEPIQLQLETVPAGAYVLIEVGDDGTGIPREIVGRIFEPFFSTKEVGSGTGLGLSTVYGIVKQTGGFIFVDSSVGKGTKFSIYLPQSAQGQNAAPKSNTIDSADPGLPRDLTGSGTVLLVEDEDPVRLFSARALRNKGYTVLEAKSGEAALKIIAETQEPIDLIVTDVVMPRMDGPTLIKHVRETLRTVKVIYISGYTEDAFRKRLDDEADIHFLPKPFSLKQLAGKVKEIMGEPVESPPAQR
jgi:two-component system cell cycle sensor histidine kinase/response regulator CckA